MATVIDTALRLNLDTPVPSQTLFSLLHRTGGVIVLFGWLAILLPLHSEPPKDLVVDGVPEVPDAMQQAVAPYFTVASNAFMSWDPKTNGMLINSVNQDIRQLHLLMAPGGETKMTTQFPDYVSGGSFMPKLGDTVVFMADHGGDEFYQLYQFDPASGKTQLLTDGDSRNSNVIYDHTGQQIAFLSLMPEGRFEVIYVMNPRNDETRKIIMSPGNNGWMLQDWAHDGLHILVSHMRWLHEGYLWSINTLTGETKLLTSTPETQRLYLEARYTPEDNGVYVIYLGDYGRQIIDYLPLTNDGPVRKVPAKVTTAQTLELSPDGTWLAYLTSEDDLQTLHIFNTITGEEQPKLSLAPANFALMRWNADSTELGFNYSTTSTPYQAYSYQVATRQLRQWTAPSNATLAETTVKPELVKIRSFDDLEVSGYLYRPDPHKFPGKRPVIVSIHGGPASEFLPGFLGAFNYYLDQMGVALLFPNVRGSTGFGPDFVDLDNGYKREDSVKDIGAFLDWIGTDSRLDSNRIGVQGGSYGGYMTLATLYHYGNRVRCGSDLMGISDFVTLLRHTAIAHQPGARYELGDERYPEMNKFLEGISPLNHAAEIHDPVMITAGKNDPRVPESESDQMVKAIRAQNGIVWYILGEDEGHGFRRISDAQYQFAAEATFYQTYLLPEQRVTPLGPAPAPASTKSADAPSSSPD